MHHPSRAVWKNLGCQQCFQIFQAIDGFLLTFQQLPCQPESLAEGAEAMGSASLWSRAVIEALVPCVEDPGYLGSLGLKSVFLWQLNEKGG